MPYHQIVEDLKQHFTETVFHQITRKNNKAIDAMATIAFMIAMPEYSPKCEFLIENLFLPTNEQPELELVCEIVSLESPWYFDIFSYLHHKTIPIALSKNQSKAFIHHTT